MILRDKIIVVDLEATCWEANPPPGQQNEIIEIGVCTLDTQTFALADKRSILVKPVRSTVSEFCTRLTTLTQAQVDGGVTFAEACQILVDDYASHMYLWGSWGMYDYKMFQQQCKSFDVFYPFHMQHLNIKRHFARQANNKRSVGMVRALEMLNLSQEGTHHRGDDDAWNIARILAYLLQTYGTDSLLPYWKNG